MCRYMCKRATIRLHDKPTVEPYDIHNLRRYDNLSHLLTHYISFSVNNQRLNLVKIKGKTSAF